MEVIKVELGAAGYNIHIGEDIAAFMASDLPAADKYFVLTDENIAALYADAPCAWLAGKEYSIYAVPAGECAKGFVWLERVLQAMSAAHLSRQSLVIAFGGGVIGDLAGFAASIYMRGIRLVQIPTTLLAMLDSSVGGKTGINTSFGKNMVGSFYQPCAVYADVRFLTNLPGREYVSGVGEGIKYGLIKSSVLEFLEAELANVLARQATAVRRLIAQCCAIKAAVVGEDAKERGSRAVLNIGHTFGHALEAAANYAGYYHGEAVAIGIYYETLLARDMGIVDGDYAERILQLVRSTGLNCALPAEIFLQLPDYMAVDKKNSGGLITFILPERCDCYRAVQLTLPVVRDFCAQQSE